MITGKKKEARGRGELYTRCTEDRKEGKDEENTSAKD